MQPDELDKFDFDPLDATKDLAGRSCVPGRQDDAEPGAGQLLPVHRAGRVQHRRYVPGIEPSEDQLLQGRTSRYADTQRHRLGPNYLMLPVNRPTQPVRNVQPGRARQPRRTRATSTTSRASATPSVAGRRPEGQGAQGAPARDRHPGVDQGPAGLQAGRRPHPRHVEGRSRPPAPQLLGRVQEGQGPRHPREFVSNLYQADADFGRRLAEAAGVELDRVKELASAR